jgi:hypothetical protein
MEAMRQSWSDDRLDHLNDRVDTGFASVDLRFEQVDRRFDEMGLRFDRVELEAREFRSEVVLHLGQLNHRFYALNRTLIVALGGLLCALIAASGGIIASLN